MSHPQKSKFEIGDSVRTIHLIDNRKLVIYDKTYDSKRKIWHYYCKCADPQGSGRYHQDVLRKGHR
jgi:hypothetical protein